MEIIIALVVVVVVGALIYFNRTAKSLDINQDGKVDLADAKAAVQNTVDGVKATADVNKDGVVDAKDAAVVAKSAAEEVKKTARRGRKAVSNVAAKVETAAKKPRGRKPKA